MMRSQKKKVFIYVFVFHILTLQIILVNIILQTIYHWACIFYIAILIFHFRIIRSMPVHLHHLKEAQMTKIKSKITPDTILKNFWKDNNRFADLFNACFFDGNPELNPDDLTEVDTDISSLLQFHGYAETVKKIVDVVKKSAYGVDFVILGIENQAKIHYAMPLRHMLGDAFSYLKEYNEIAKKYKDEKPHGTPDEFLSKMKKTDRLHSVLTICIYYGETPWDGPRSLIDMLEIPDAFKPLISDYKFNLIELRKSEHLKFHNNDVDKIFNISRFIFDEKYDKITDIFKDENISSELAMVIGCITESQKLINDAVESEEKGGSVNMCKALERLPGQIVTKLKLILKKVHKNKSFDQIVDELEEDSDVVQPLYDFVLKHIDLGEDEMVQKYLENIK